MSTQFEPLDQELIDAGCVVLGDRIGEPHFYEVGSNDVYFQSRHRRFRIARADFDRHAPMFERLALKHSLIRVDPKRVH